MSIGCSVCAGREGTNTFDTIAQINPDDAIWENFQTIQFFSKDRIYKYTVAGTYYDKDFNVRILDTPTPNIYLKHIGFNDRSGGFTTLHYPHPEDGAPMMVAHGMEPYPQTKEVPDGLGGTDTVDLEGEYWILYLQRFENIAGAIANMNLFSPSDLPVCSDGAGDSTDTCSQHPTQADCDNESGASCTWGFSTRRRLTVDEIPRVLYVPHPRHFPHMHRKLVELPTTLATTITNDGTAFFPNDYEGTCSGGTGTTCTQHSTEDDCAGESVASCTWTEFDPVGQTVTWYERDSLRDQFDPDMSDVDFAEATDAWNVLDEIDKDYTTKFQKCLDTELIANLSTAEAAEFGNAYSLCSSCALATAPCPSESQIVQFYGEVDCGDQGEECVVRRRRLSERRRMVRALCGPSKVSKARAQCAADSWVKKYWGTRYMHRSCYVSLARRKRLRLRGSKYGR